MAHDVRALCRCGISIPSTRNRCPALVEDKYLEPMFGDFGQARTKAATLLMMIDTTSSRTFNNTNVVRSCLYTVVNTLLNCQGSIFYLKCYYYLHNVSGDNA